MGILNRDRKFNIDMTHREEVLTQIAKQLEEKFGRGKPSIYEYRDYERNKEQIIEKVKKVHHTSEKDLPGSERVLLKNIETDPINNLESVSSEDEDDKGLVKYCERTKRDGRNTDRNIIEKGPTRYADSRQYNKP